MAGLALALWNALCLVYSVTVTPFSDEVIAPDASPFVATASAGGSSASQDSEIGDASIRAEGSHAATAEFSVTGAWPTTILHGEECDVSSRSQVVFSVGDGVEFRLTGSILTSGMFSNAATFVRLTGPSGLIHEARVDSDPYCTDPGCTTVGPEPVSARGWLAPGTYTFEIESSGTATGFWSTSGTVVGNVGGSYDVLLTLTPPPVPSASPPASALLVLALVAAALHGLRNESTRIRKGASV